MTIDAKDILVTSLLPDQIPGAKLQKVFGLVIGNRDEKFIQLKQCVQNAYPEANAIVNVREAAKANTVDFYGDAVILDYSQQ